ncbi:MAG: peptidylprolyl isomerase [Thermoguttaceae bacterium]|nr:peptidylprolyl isomerase [Thermoguttaceae bacterium]MDW8039645.1 peptidylprolyl isomerase [Thermoguttaceae bacterium]
MQVGCSIPRLVPAVIVCGTALCWAVEIVAFQKPNRPPLESSAGGSSSVEEDFQKIFREWKNLLEQLRRLVEEYSIADPARRAEILPNYRQQLQHSEALLPRLVEAAEKAYRHSPQPESQLQEFLLAYFYERVAQDDYEIAYRIGSLLLQRGCQDRRLTNMTAYAAFCVNQYDEAWQLFQKAKAEGKYRPLDRKDVLNATVEEFLRNPDSFREAWQRELKFRQAEQQADNLPRVRLRTNRGDLVVELFEDQAPNTVANFISLVERGFYNGLTFHRVIEGFMAQTGCPKGDGTGGPGYAIACECYQPNRRQHFRAVLSMAHAGRDTGGSQFFITFVPTPHLDSRIDPKTGQPELDPETSRPYVGHTVFGRVIEGMEVLAKIQRRSPTNPDAPPADKILKAVVLRKRPHPYVPQKIEPDRQTDQPRPDAPTEKKTE